MKAVFAGSFSPPTLGHLDLIRRSAAMFDEVVVAVMSQRAKQYLFTPEMRKEMLQAITKDLKNVRVICDDGLLVDVVKREGADIILRGLRNAQDLVFETQLAQANYEIGNAETLFIACRPEYSMISSTIVRDCASHGAPIHTMVPEAIIGQVYAAYGIEERSERKE